MTAHVLDLGLDVATGIPGQVWQLDTPGSSELGLTTWLASSDAPPGVWQSLDGPLVEVTWRQGTSNRAPRVVPRPEPGTLEATLIDPDLELLPVSGDFRRGLRPGRPVRVVDRATGTVIWSGYLESADWDLSPANPLHHVRLTGHDDVTRCARSTRVEPARPAESSRARVDYLMATYAPDRPYRVSPAMAGTVAPTVEGSLWDSLLDAADAELGWLWVRRDGTVDVGAGSDIHTAGELHVLDDPALPVSFPAARWDAYGWQTRTTVTRRDDPDAVPQTAVRDDAEQTFGVWSDSPIDSYPVPTDADAARAANLAVAWRGWPRVSTANLTVNAGAAKHLPGGAQLVELATDLQLGDLVDAPAAGLPIATYPLLVVGWEWTWSALGALLGMLSLELPVLDAVTAGYWRLGVPGASELGVTTTLAPAGGTF